MKTANSDLKALLACNAPYQMADLFEFDFLNHETLYMTSFDRPIEVDYKVYFPAIIERSNIKTNIGVEVDTLQLTLYGRQKDQVANVSIIAAAFKGLLDGARVTLKRAFLTEGRRIPVGSIHLFSGRISDISGSQTKLQIAVKSDLEILNAKVPRNIYQASCLNTLYDGVCQIRQTWFDGYVDTVGTNHVVATLGGGVQHAHTASYFNNGIIVFKDGLNKDITRSIKKYVEQGTRMTDPKEFHFLQPFPNTIKTDDHFQVCAGCDKTQATCKSRFNNISNFRGFPFIPEPETAQ